MKLELTYINISNGATSDKPHAYNIGIANSGAGHWNNQQR